MAQMDLYDNGPINGQSNAWTINFGFAVSDSVCCRVPGGPPVIQNITNMSFGAWLVPGDELSTLSVEVMFSSAPFGGGDAYFDQFVNFTASGCNGNTFGFNYCTENSAAFSATVPTGPDPYWVTLQNASVPSGNPVYWDENSGVGCQGSGGGMNCPSQAQENTVGTIPSEAFTIFGTQSSSTSTSTTSTGTTPEPSSVLLFATSILALVGGIRRRLG